MWIIGAGSVRWLWFEKMGEVLKRRPTAAAITEGLEMDLENADEDTNGIYCKHISRSHDSYSPHCNLSTVLLSQRFLALTFIPRFLLFSLLQLLDDESTTGSSHHPSPSTTPTLNDNSDTADSQPNPIGTYQL